MSARSVEGSTPQEYEAVLLQFQPDPTSEERLNVGVVAFAAASQELAFNFSEHYSRIRGAFPSVHGSDYRAMIRQIEAEATRARQARVSRNGQPRLAVDVSLPAVLADILKPGGSFRWSSVRYGVCSDLQTRVAEMFRDYVGQHEEAPARPRVDERTIWEQTVQHPAISAVLRSERLDEDVEIKTDRYSYRFKLGWVNGRQQVAEPVSLDYKEPRDITEKAIKWVGRLHELASSNPFELVAIVSPMPAEETGRAATEYKAALQLLKDAESVRKVLTVDDQAKLARLIQADLQSRSHD